jgi:hypothetical protein
MHCRFLRLALAFACVTLSACAALITGSGTPEDQIIRTGMTETQLSQRLGPPIRNETVSPARAVWDLRESDPQVRLLVYPEYGFDPAKGSYPIRPPDLAVSESVFRFSGRVGKDTRAVQPSFDSFMTLGLAEIFLVPKALLERARQDDSLLTVWFDSQGRALAYKWMLLQEPSPR